MSTPERFFAILSTTLVLGAIIADSSRIHADPVYANVGPYGTPVYGIAIDPRLPSILYVGTGTGVYRSADSGRTWAAASAGLSGSYIDTIAINPVTTTTLYAAGRYNDRLFKSTDSGGTWSQTPFRGDAGGAAGRETAIDPITPSTVYATSDEGFFKSTDAGDTWIRFSTGMEGTPVEIAIDPFTPSTLYAGTSQGVYKSTDSGFTWTAAKAGLPTGPDSQIRWVYSLAVNPNDPTIIYAGTNGGGLYKSTDSGAKWYSFNNSTTINTYVRQLVINPKSPSTLYMGGYRAGSDTLFRSTDAGTTWTELKNGLSLSASNGLNCLAIDPATPSTLYAGLDKGLFKSTDAGDSWIQLTDSVSSFNLTLAKGGSGTGTVSSTPPGIACGSQCTAVFTAGTTVSLTATADPGSTFAGWGGDCSGSGICQVTMSQAHSVTATFTTEPTSQPALLLSQGRVAATLTWRSQYNGNTGVGTPIRQLDQYGYFWFTSADNPEVFVKVLDFGGDSYLVFHSSLSDLEYAVTFKVLRTGQTYSFTRSAGSVCGLADGITVKK